MYTGTGRSGMQQSSAAKERMVPMKKYIAEFIGTFTLVLIGCGTAMLVGCDAANGCGYILTAFAFGLTIVGMAYCVGNISGCHINPAVSLGVLMSGGMTAKEFVGYVVAQCLGAFSAAPASLGCLGGVCCPSASCSRFSVSPRRRHITALSAALSSALRSCLFTSSASA